MSRPVTYDRRAQARREAEAMRRLVQNPPTRLRRFWRWLNTPMKG